MPFPGQSEILLEKNVKAEKFAMEQRRGREKRKQEREEAGDPNAIR